MDCQRLGVKMFLGDPTSLAVRDLIPVFHSWIQEQVIANHLLVDIHDYSHVNMGPGILLVAHEGNFSLDQAEGRPGLNYYRKQRIEGSLESRLKAICRTTLIGCQLLEKTTALNGIRFKTDELLLVVNDRLQAPNNEETFQQIEPELSGFFRGLFNDNNVTLTHRIDAKERFAVEVTATSHSGGIADLLERLS